MVYAWNAATGTSPRCYQGGSLAYALVGALVIAAAMQPGPLRRVLAVGPLAWIGRLSYGLYLFHWPLIVWLVPSRADIDGLALDGLRLSLTFVAATASYYLIELPVRERRLPAVLRALTPSRRHQARPKRDVTRWLPVPATCLTVAAVLASASGATPPPSYLVGERPAASAPRIWRPRRPGCGSCSWETRRPAASSPAWPRSVTRSRRTSPRVRCSVAASPAGTSPRRATSRSPSHSERCPEMVDQATTRALQELQPNVVVWMSIWEKSDLVVDGRTLASGTEAGDAEMLRRMDATLDRITAGGAKVVILTVAAPAPNDAQGASNSSNEVDDASYARLDRIVRRFADRHTDEVTLVDLARRVCPDGPPCPDEVGGVRLRPDGRHFTPAAATIEAHWPLPKLLEAACS